jgi:hypothetical protein
LSTSKDSSSTPLDNYLFILRANFYIAPVRKKKGGRHDSSMKSSKNENCERAEALTSKTFENNFEKHSRGMFPAGQAAQRAAIRSPSLHPVFRR